MNMAGQNIMQKSFKILKNIIFIALLCGGTPILPAIAADSGKQQAMLSYADLADLVTASPLIVDARIKRAETIEIGGQTETQPMEKRVLVNAKVNSLIRGQNGISPTVSFLAGKTVTTGQLRKEKHVLLFAKPAPRAGQIVLVSRNARQPWSEELDQTVRSIAIELLQSDSPPAIMKVGDAFHSAGTVAGESETQIFLKTYNQAAISLSVIRRPGQTPRWGVSLGEIVDEAAAPPQRNTLLWYRLACSLPPRLPAETLQYLSLQDAQAAQRDYTLIMESLGSCGRTL